MTRIKIKKIKWDSWNLEHIIKHKVEVEEIVEASKNLYFHRKTDKGRYLAVGRTGTRLLTLIINRESVGIYYLITAFDTAKKDRKKVYEKEK